VDLTFALKAPTWVTHSRAQIVSGLTALQAKLIHWVTALQEQTVVWVTALQNDTIIIYWLLVAVMVVGVIGSVVPALPGVALIVIAIVVWGAIKGFATVAVSLGVAIAVFLLGIGVDFLATFWGAKKAGASRWGQIGAIVGLIAGVLGFLPALPIGGPILGLLIGPFLGAFIGELLHRRKPIYALKAAVGVVVSTLIGNLIQGLMALATLIVFLVTTWPL
jgi:uncharacterized protein